MRAPSSAVCGRGLETHDMRKKHLRDIKDYFKGWIISLSTHAGSLDLRVVPMITDDPEQPAGRWSSSDWGTYAFLLNVPEAAILLKDRHLVYTRDRQVWQSLNKPSKDDNFRLWADERRAYFGEALASHGGDFFLDPDTGICTPNSEAAFPIYQVSEGKERLDQSYLYRAEIARLLGGDDRVVVVFQDAHRNKGYLDDVLKSLTPEGMAGLKEYGKVAAAPPTLHAFAYDAVHSCAVFVCRNESRLTDLKRMIREEIPKCLADESIVG